MSFSNLKISSQEIFFLPNILTYLRLLCLPLIYVLLVEEKLLSVALISLFAIGTDILDGILARKLKQTSNLGRILDPLVDKIAIAVFAIYVVFYREFPLGVALFVILKDLAILVGSLFLLRKFQKIPVSDRWGKFTALIWAFCILSYILNLKLVKEVLLVGGLILTVFSAISYSRRFLEQLKIGKI